ncbi:MAG: HK97 family phage prohead protease [Proteobacteria bacterium]|nr:HK97 family phage prohead protease [Pseudomonadota bacterium]
MRAAEWHKRFGGGGLERAAGWPSDLEFSSPVGGIRMGGFAGKAAARPAKSQVQRYIGGYATMWNKAHVHQGRFEIFDTGAFAPTLLSKGTVRFLDEHEESKCLGATNGFGLELWSDETGLGFKLAVPDTELGDLIFDDVKMGRRRGMSVRYRATETYDLQSNGETCCVIKAAHLNEISLCKRGAVAQAFAEVVTDPSAVVGEIGDACTKAAERVSGAFREVRELLERME